jgi:hypothetical protein
MWSGVSIHYTLAVCYTPSASQARSGRAQAGPAPTEQPNWPGRRPYLDVGDERSLDSANHGAKLLLPDAAQDPFCLAATRL